MDTIKSSQEISYLFSHGKRVTNPYVTIIYSKRQMVDRKEIDMQHGLNGRVAFIAGKKSGNAVWRNRAKRRLRAICRELGGPWAGYDVIFLAKSSLTLEDYSKVKHACFTRLKDLNFFKKA